MEDDFLRVSITLCLDIAPSTSKSILGYYRNSVNSDAPLSDFSGLSDLAASSSFVPLAKVALRTQQYLYNVVHYSRKRGSCRPAS